MRWILGLAMAAALVVVPTAASAATVPSAPFCDAIDVTGLPGVVGHKADVVWAPPDSDGGSPITRYVTKRKGTTTPVFQTDNDDDGFYNSPPKGGAARGWRWDGDAFPFTDDVTVFQLRAVNAVGFGPWCEITVHNTGGPPPPPTRPFIAYTSNSWLKTTLTGLGKSVDSAKTTAMRTFINSHDPNTNPNLAGLGTNKFGEGYDMSDCSDPVWTLSGGTIPSQWASLRTSGFHADASFGSFIPTGSDGPIVVIDRCNGFTVWASKITKGTGNVLNIGTGGAAGAFVHSSNGLDRRATGSDSAVNERSRGVIPDSMVIRHDQLAYAIANNSDLGQRLEIFWWETDSSAGMISPPMAGFESGQSGWGAEGQLIGVDTTFTPSASCSPAAKAIIRTLQNYGAYIGDNAGAGGTALKMEQDHGQWADMDVSQRAFDSCGLTWNNFVAY